MKNLFVFIAVFFGGFVLSLTLSVIFLLYGNRKLEIAFFIAAGAFFIVFSVFVAVGVLKSYKAKNSDKK